ncbi:MAG: MscL family protein [Candidatus Saccharimonadales bacterium]
MAARSDKQPPNRPQIITSGPVRLQSPRSYDRQPQHHLSDLEVGTGFMEFLREHAVVALAIGFVIATQIQALAKQLIASFVDPAFKLLFGEKLSQKTFTLHFHGRAANFGWGSFIYAVLDVLFVLLSIYVVVKLFKLEKLENPKKKKARGPDTEDNA